MRRLALTLVTACSLLTVHGVGAELVTRDVYMMGTRAHLATYGTTRQSGLATLASAMVVLERTENELSTWRESSDISALNRHPVGTPWQANPRLCQMFAEVWHWHRLTDGAFDPGIGRMLAAWDVHGPGALPDPETRTHVEARSGLGLISFDATQCTMTKRADVAIDVGAFGKGEALDRIESALGTVPWMLDLGGQVSVGGMTGNGGWEISIADPRRRDQSHLHLRLREGSLSTSGGTERDLMVNGTRIGHIFDPRRGRPASFSGSVTVWHRRGLAADALSTALYVMGPDEGMRWAETHGIAALYLIPDDWTVRAVATQAFKRSLPYRD